MVREGAVARFCLDSEDGRQTLSPGILSDLASRARREADSGARVIVVESARPGLFAAGADLAVIRGLSPRDAFSYAREGQTMIRSLAGLPAAVLAEIDGACFGGACDLALGCDVRIATTTAKFSHPGPRIGIVTGWGGTALARARLGRGQARRLFRDGSVFGAREALAMGLVDEVVACERWTVCRGEVERRLSEDAQFGEIKLSGFRRPD